MREGPCRCAVTLPKRKTDASTDENNAPMLNEGQKDHVAPAPGHHLATALFLFALSTLVFGCASRGEVTGGGSPVHSETTSEGQGPRTQDGVPMDVEQAIEERLREAGTRTSPAERALALRQTEMLLAHALRFEMTLRSDTALERASQWRVLNQELANDDVATSDVVSACHEALNGALWPDAAQRCAEAGLDALVKLEALRRVMLSAERWSRTGRASGGVFDALECGPAGTGAFRHSGDYAGDDELAALRSRDEAMCFMTASVQLAAEVSGAERDALSRALFDNLEERAMTWLAAHPLPVELLTLRGDDDVSLSPAQARMPNVETITPRFHAGQSVMLARSRGIALGQMPQWSAEGYTAPAFEERFSALGYGFSLEQMLSLRETMEALRTPDNELLVVVDAALRWRQLSGPLREALRRDLEPQFVIHELSTNAPFVLRMQSTDTASCAGHLSVRSDGLLVVLSDGTLLPVPWALDDERQELRAALTRLLNECGERMSLRVEDEMADWGQIVRVVETLTVIAAENERSAPMIELVVDP